MISIIIPVYNVEKYLPRCLDSILEQTYVDYEAILIDDASTDSSKSICRTYAMKDARIRLLENDRNYGLSYTRNRGLKICKGEYITFVDSDDEISPCYLEFMLKSLQDYSIEIVSAKSQRITEDSRGPYLFQDKNRFSVSLVNSSKLLEDILSSREGNPVWGKLYRKESIMDLRFQESMNYEDILYSAQVLTNVKHIALIDRVLYFYRQVGTSIVHTRNLKSLDALKAQELRLAIVKEHFPDLYELALGRLLTTCISFRHESHLIKDSNERQQFNCIVNDCWERHKLSLTELFVSGYPISRKLIFLVGNGSLYLAGNLKHFLLEIYNR